MTDTAVNDDTGPIRRGRDARAAKRRNRARTWLPELERKIPWVDLLSEEQVRTIHEASMDIIEEVGVEFRCEDAIAMWKGTGASVDGVRVRIDRVPTGAAARAGARRDRVRLPRARRRQRGGPPQQGGLPFAVADEGGSRSANSA